MSERYVSPGRADVVGIDEITACVASSAESHDATRASYERIGELLVANVARLNLDEDLGLLMDFANRVGRESLTEKVRTYLYPDGCWLRGRFDDTPPFLLKDHGQNSPQSRVESVERQKAEMVKIVAHLAEADPALKAGAHALVEYIRANGLLPATDEEEANAL